MIYDHVSGRLSSLDEQVVAAVRPGGNWRDLPADFDSRRIEQIRRGAAEGEGSRSTYYGRMRWDRPAYTISTYFNRPGNGCFIHPAAARLITIREAARLQSFPDTYRFSGIGRRRYVQVGNAVPPLLAYQIAKSIPSGPTVDLFAGAGGLSLGFSWAGHRLVGAVDNEAGAIETLRRNGAHEPLQADLSDPEEHTQTMRELVRRAGDDRIQTVVGGPPCQGFSTAGRCRLDDPRNKLVFSFLSAVDALKPRFVLMENVAALLWRGRRATLDELQRELRRLGYHATSLMIAHAEGYGVPQLRRRLFLFGSREGLIRWPRPWCQVLEPAQRTHQPGADQGRHAPITVGEAMSDLPEETAAAADIGVPYAREATSAFQRWARGEQAIEELLPPLCIADGGIQEELFEVMLAR